MIAALLVAAASAGPVAWSWPGDGLTYRLEAELGFAEPVALELGEYAPRVSSLRLVARTWCAPEEKGLRCMIQDARLQMETSRASYGTASDVLSRLQQAVEGASVEVRAGERGQLRRVRATDYDGDAQTGALYEALVETLFWSLDLQSPGDPAAEQWRQRGTLQDLDAGLEHRRAAPLPEHPTDQHILVAGDGADRVEGWYTFDDRGWVVRSELAVELAHASGGPISLDAADVHPATRGAAATFMKVGSEREPDR